MGMCECLCEAADVCVWGRHGCRAPFLGDSLERGRETSPKPVGTVACQFAINVRVPWSSVGFVVV